MRPVYDTYVLNPNGKSSSSNLEDEILDKRSMDPRRVYTHYTVPAKPMVYLDEPVKQEKRKSPRNIKKSLIAMGVLQILLGLFAIISGVVLMMTNYYDGFWPTYYEVKFIDYLGTGIWCGVIFLVSGSAGLIAGIKGNSCSLTTFLVTSIFSSLMCVPLVGTSFLGALISPRGSIHLGFFIAQIAVSLAVAAVAIASAVILCGRICCKPKPEPTVLYKATGPLPSSWPRY